MQQAGACALDESVTQLLPHISCQSAQACCNTRSHPAAPAACTCSSCLRQEAAAAVNWLLLWSLTTGAC